MADVVDTRTRSRMMSGIRGKDTRPELMIRKGLFAKGFRYRLHDRSLPGCPDLVFPSRKAVIFVHGCFWHQHRCHLFKWPATRREFWKAKLDTNAATDLKAIRELMKEGWRVMIIWECALKGRTRRTPEWVSNRASSWLESGRGHIEVTGMPR